MNSQRALQNCILRTASFLVPAPQRQEWLREWHGEVGHARETATPAADLTRICLGSLKDAYCLGRIAPREAAPASPFRGSALQCLLCLIAALAVSYGFSRLLPGVRAEIDPSHYKVRPDLILIQDAASTNDAVATISARDYTTWASRRQRYFDEFAFYRIARDLVSADANETEPWTIAHASPNLFSILGLAVRFASDDNPPGVVLSDTIWRRDFGANRSIAGSEILIAGRSVRVLGVVTEGAWRMPGRVDAWLLEPVVPNARSGYMIAHLNPLGIDATLGQSIAITALNGDEDDVELNGVSFGERTQGPWRMYLFTLFVAFLALPAVTSVSLGEYNFSDHKPSRTSTVLRWSFLLAKIALLLPTVYYTSLDIAYCRTTCYSVPAQYAQLASSFSLCLFGLSWALLDQRRRCPVCLRRVTHPARVGLAGRTFLAWNGTELICSGGHTLLHVPALPTSWFSTQRWLYLDTSWKFLFSAPNAS